MVRAYGLVVIALVACLCPSRRLYRLALSRHSPWVTKHRPHVAQAGHEDNEVEQDTVDEPPKRYAVPRHEKFCHYGVTREPRRSMYKCSANDSTGIEIHPILVLVRGPATAPLSSNTTRAKQMLEPLWHDRPHL